MTRIQVAHQAWQRDSQSFMEKFVPMFFNGLDSIQQKQNISA